MTPPKRRLFPTTKLSQTLSHWSDSNFLTFLYEPDGRAKKRFSSNNHRTTVSHSIPNVVQLCKLLKYVWSTRTIYRNICYLAYYTLPNRIWGLNHFRSTVLGRSEMNFFNYPQSREGLPCKRDGGNFLKNRQELPRSCIFISYHTIWAQYPKLPLKLLILRSTKPLFRPSRCFSYSSPPPDSQRGNQKYQKFRPDRRVPLPYS